MQFATDAKKNKRKHLRCDCESANLPFDADNLKLDMVQFLIISFCCGRKNTKTALEDFDMITGEMKNKVDSILDTIWTDGITSPITVLEQITYLMFMKLLDDNQLKAEANASLLGVP